MMKLSIIIVSFNTQKVLDECISSILKSSIKIPYEIIVVDNASYDGSVEMLEQKYPDVKLIKNIPIAAGLAGGSTDAAEMIKALNILWDLNLTKEELIDYATRSGAWAEVVENLEELEDDGEIYESIEDIWPDYPTKDDFFFNEEEY